MIDYSPSDSAASVCNTISTMRGPETDNQFILQYIVSIGAHGAHQY